MLQSRLTVASLATLATLVLAACGGGGPIEDNVVRPGITAMDQAQTLACGTDRQTLTLAIEAYTLLNNQTPTDESVLVPDFLREPTTSWNVVNGQIVAENPACGEVATETIPPVMTAPATTLGSIVTSTEPPMTAELLLASFSPAQVESFGGVACATELAAILVAGDRYVTEQGIAPIDLEDLFVAGYLTERATLWVATADTLLPAPGSGCTDPAAATQTDTCEAERKTLEVAREAYLAQFGDSQEPTEADLVTVGFLREQIDGFDLVNGVVTPDVGGRCDTTSG